MADETTPVARRAPIYHSLFFQLAVAIVAGIVVGWSAPGHCGHRDRPVVEPVRS